MGDTVLDGGVQPAPQGPGSLSAPWGRTVIDESAPTSRVFAAFRIVSGVGAGRIFDLKVSGDTRMGRDAALNDVVINDSRASAQQMIVRSDGEEFGVIDLGSANGTFVNGEKVLAPVVLHPDDRVRVGDTVMVFHLAHAAEVE